MSGSHGVSVTETIELAAIRDVFRAAPPELAARHGIEIAEVGGVTVTALRDVPSNSMFDRALGLGLERPLGEAALDEVCTWFDDRGIDLFVSVAPAARPPELPEWLAQRGFDPAWAWMKFTRGVEPLRGESEPLRVERAEQDHLAALGHIVSTAFGLPEWFGEWLAALHGRRGWSLQLAWDGGTPVGAAGLFVRGRTGYLTFGSVLPEHRGKGAQRALFAARIREAAALGCERLVTETGVREPGKASFSYANILRAGFEEQYVRPNYVRRAAHD